MELYAYSGGTVRDSHPIPLSIPADWYAPRGHKNIFCCPLYTTICFFFSQPTFCLFWYFLVWYLCFCFRRYYSLCYEYICRVLFLLTLYQKKKHNELLCFSFGVLMCQKSYVPGARTLFVSCGNTNVAVAPCGTAI